MQEVFTEDQLQFRDVVRKFLDDQSPMTAVRALQETEAGFDAKVWHSLGRDLGLPGTHLPEAYGGLGFGPIELGIILEEMGRSLYCGPFFSSAVMAGYAVSLFADEARRQALIPELSSGDLRATLVLDSLNSPEQVGKTLAVDSAEQLTGRAEIVIDGSSADELFVMAESPEGLGLYHVSPSASGVNLQARESIDLARKLSRVAFDHAPAQKLGRVDPSGLQRFWNLACVALSHEMIGGAGALLESTVEYTKIRVQFGRPIGSFQALKHRCADLLMSLEFAKAATYQAAFGLAVDKGPSFSANMAKAMASDCFMETARAAIQLRGGLGFTWEDDTHLYFKRAKCDEVLLGLPHVHRERMIQQMEDSDRAA